MRVYFKIIPSVLLLASFVSCQTKTDLPAPSSSKIKILQPLAPFDSNTMDGLLVSVSDKVILLSDFQNAVLAASNEQTTLSKTGKLVGGTFSIEKANELLQSLINQKVIEIKASELGIIISDAELTSRIDEFLKRQSYTQADLETQLKNSGQSLTVYRENFRKELIRQELISRVISPRVTVTEDEVNNYYLQKTGSVKQVTAVKLRSLMLNLPENYSGSPLEYKPVVEIQKSILEGKNFEDLVTSYSQEKSVHETKGILPSRPVQALPPELQEKLTQLKINDVVGPLSIGNSIFFFQYLGAEFGSGSDLKTSYFQWKNKLLNLKFEENLSSYLANEKSLMHVNIRPFTITR